MNIERYLSSFFKGTKEPSLNAMKYFMEEFKHPEKQLKCIHIAGTNGKGSVTEMMSNILIKNGYKVGKFISPHLEKYNERITINNKEITNNEMEELIKEMQPKIEKYNKENDINVSLFELETTMALIYFYRNKVDLVVLEVGLGGLYDCTNIVMPIISVINSISYDHMQILGNTLEEIAVQKAGIIKENSQTVYFEQEHKINNIIKEKCREKNNILHEIKKENIKNYSYNNEFQKFDYKLYKEVLVNLKGKKQIQNAAICLECCDILKEKGYKLEAKKIKEGVSTVIYRGRFEKIHENPDIIYDGGHNLQAIENLKETINMYYKERKKVFIIQILKTKDYKSVLNELVDEEAEYIFTNGNDEKRFVSKLELFENAKSLNRNENLKVMELKDAIKFAKDNLADEVVFVVGSFYVYGTVKLEID